MNFGVVYLSKIDVPEAQEELGRAFRLEHNSCLRSVSASLRRRNSVTHHITTLHAVSPTFVVRVKEYKYYVKRL